LERAPASVLAWWAGCEKTARVHDNTQPALKESRLLHRKTSPRKSAVKRVPSVTRCVACETSSQKHPTLIMILVDIARYMILTNFVIFRGNTALSD